MVIFVFEKLLKLHLSIYESFSTFKVCVFAAVGYEIVKLARLNKSLFVWHFIVGV